MPLCATLNQMELTRVRNQPFWWLEFCQAEVPKVGISPFSYLAFSQHDLYGGNNFSSGPVISLLSLPLHAAQIAVEWTSMNV